MTRIETTTTQTRNVPFVDLKAQYETIAADVKAAIVDVLERADFVLGHDVSLLEEEFARYIGGRHAIGVGSGGAALELALRASGVGPGDEVITVANTFVGTVFAIEAVGARPVLVDADQATYNIDAQAISAAITPRTRAIIPVHLYGQPADLEAIVAVARHHQLVVVEDVAQAHGARYSGRRAGSWGDAAAFSFYPAKNLGAYGDGGMIVTSRPEIAERARLLRNYGEQTKSRHVIRGTNSRLDTLQAAVLRVKLRKLDAWNAARQQRAVTYDAMLARLPVVRPLRADKAEHVYHLYVIQVEHRDQIRESLRRQGVTTGVHYPVPVHLQEACVHLGYRRGDFPNIERAAGRVLSLPMYPELTAEQAERVAEALQRSCGESTGRRSSPSPL